MCGRTEISKPKLYPRLERNPPVASLESRAGSDPQPQAIRKVFRHMSSVVRMGIIGLRRGDLGTTAPRPAILRNMGHVVLPQSSVSCKVPCRRPRLESDSLCRRNRSIAAASGLGRLGQPTDRPAVPCSLVVWLRTAGSVTNWGPARRLSSNGQRFCKGLNGTQAVGR